MILLTTTIIIVRIRQFTYLISMSTLFPIWTEVTALLLQELQELDQ